MSKMRIAVFGASGFVGSTLVEQFLHKNDGELRVCIHSAGNVWRLARHGMKFHFVDIRSRAEVREALEGCTHVVNCTRGPDEVMVEGLRNLLEESQAQGVQRFVHLSSVAVYGDPPPPESTHEDAKPHPAPQSYGWVKLRQDSMVQRAYRRGLSSIILCPPNISGIFSPFVSEVLQDMRNGTLALVDGGETALNIVDAENLCHAIELALTCEEADGQRMFVTDAETLTWKDFTKMLLPLAERSEPLPSVTRADIFKGAATGKRGRLSPVRSLKHLVSSSVREALREDPLLEKIDQGIRASIALLPDTIEDGLRCFIEGPIQVAKITPSTRYSSRYNAQQLRGVYHSCERAQKMLNYTPKYTFKQSMERFCAWYQALHGFGTVSWKLVRELEEVR